MTNLKAILIALLLCSPGLAADVHVLIFAGQSNCAGYGNRLQLAPVPAWAQTAAGGWTGAPTASSDTGIEYPHPSLANAPMLYNLNVWTSPYVVNGWGGFLGEVPQLNGTLSEEPHYGPELSFMVKYQADHPGQNIAVVKCGVGGTGIKEWIPYHATTNPYGGTVWPQFQAQIQQAKARILAAGNTPVWGGMLWMQGETGASGYYEYVTNSTIFRTQTRDFLALVRAETDAELPIVIGRIGEHLLADSIIGTTSSGQNTPANRYLATQWRRQLQVEVGGDPGNAWVDTDDLPVLQTGDPQWWYHHTGAGYLAMGERFYDKWQVLVGEESPPPPPPLVLIIKRNGIQQTILSGSVKVNGQVIGEPGQTIEVEYQVGE